MASYYLIERIEEALELNNGHAIKARRTLESWCRTDIRLVNELVEPFLMSIIGRKLQSFLPNSGEAEKGAERGSEKKTSLSQTDMNNVINQMSANKKSTEPEKKTIKPIEWSKVSPKIEKIHKYTERTVDPLQAESMRAVIKGFSSKN